MRYITDKQRIAVANAWGFTLLEYLLSARQALPPPPDGELTIKYAIAKAV
jgi:hypothetical protein